MISNFFSISRTKLYHKALETLGKLPDVAHMHKDWMADAGFINVQEKIVNVPQNSWPEGKKEKE